MRLLLFLLPACILGCTSPNAQPERLTYRSIDFLELGVETADEMRTGLVAYRSSDWPRARAIFTAARQQALTLPQNEHLVTTLDRLLGDTLYQEALQRISFGDRESARRLLGEAVVHDPLHTMAFVLHKELEATSEPPAPVP